VARNEEFAVDKCLSALVQNQGRSCQVICVDSDSTDSTLEVMKSYVNEFEDFRIYKIEGEINSAIARNVGILNATGDILVFIDGDTEIDPGFLDSALNVIDSGKADAVCGIIDDHIYSDNYERLCKIKENRHRLDVKHLCKVHYSGGNFIATRDVVNKAGYFDEVMYRHQDIDYTARIAHSGNFVSTPVRFGIHHTLAYKDRGVGYFLSLYPMLFGRLLRKNILHPPVFVSLLKKSRDVSGGIAITLLLLVVFCLAEIGFSLKLLTVVLTVDILTGIAKRQSIINRLVVHYLYPYLVIPGMLITVHKNLKYTVARVA
jgi:glycosyltransferase involved in cell wall biosynthesis